MTEQAVNETVEDQQPSTPGLTIQDLITVAQIIQLTNQRGAFRAEELAAVGTLYNKLIAFLESVGAISRPDSVESNTAQENSND